MSIDIQDRPIHQLESLAEDIPENAVDATARLWKAASQHREKGASVARMLNAVAWLTEESEIRPMSEAAGAASDFDVLLELLQRPEILDTIRRNDPLAHARLRGIEAQQRLIAAEGGTVSSSEAAALLGVSRQTVDNRRKTAKLLAVSLGRHGYAYPAWQFLNGQTLPGLQSVLSEFDRRNPWELMAFFLNENAWVDGDRPLDLLRQGDVEPVRQAAAMYGQQSAR